MLNRVYHNLAKTAILAGALALGEVNAASAQTISNTANIQWQIGSQIIGENSNKVSIAVQPLPPQSLSLYQFSTPPGAASFNVPSTVCHGSSGDKPVALGGVFAGTPVAPASLNPATEIHAGEPLILSVTSSADNRDPNAVDTLVIRISTPSGDSERLTLVETGANTSVFVGMINTAAIPPTPVSGDCILSVQPGDSISLIGTRISDGSTIAAAKVNVLVDPYGITFDSGDGSPVAGSQVTLLNADTNQPADVFGDDGLASFPSTVTTGATVTDSGGNSYTFPTGDYRFPFVKAGHYRLVVKPPPPYTAPSTAPPTALAGLVRPDGQPFTIVPGSYSQVFTLSDPAPVRIDIPIDKPGAPLVISKTASKPVAVPGDSVQYQIHVQNGDAGRATGAITLTDTLPPAMRLVANTVRVSGIKSAYKVTNGGRTLSIATNPLAAGQFEDITYVLEVRPDAQAGNTLNLARARDDRGTQSAIASAAVRIALDGISDRLTIEGRIVDGGCLIDPGGAKGIGNVRVMMEDGSYVISDSDGRYHFDGVLPGTHVVQVDPSTYPANLVPIDCSRNTRTAGSAISRFVSGGGGALLRADFYGAPGTNTARAANLAPPRPTPPSDQDAAATNREWVDGEEPGIGFLYPAVDQNPRTKVTRVAIKHLPGQTVKLFTNGVAVSAMAADGERKSGDGQIVVSLWRAVDLDARDTQLTAEVHDASGKLVQTLSRNVHFASNAIHAVLLRDKSLLVADGVNRPLIAFRLTDRDGKPIHHGQVGDFAVPAPYAAAVEADAQAARGLTGLERGKPAWRVEGDDGIAYIELEPTTASGSLSITLPFRDGDVSHSERLETWLAPGKRPWTIVGLAEGTIGFNRLDRAMQNVPDDGTTWHTDGRIALYVKGRITGKWLLTLAYDSAKKTANTTFGSTIDPKAYYTVYADRSDKRYDASSVRKLYLKLERPQFYALFGDYDTGITEPQLARYTRAFNGIKSEFRNERVGIVAFAADTPYSHRRQEIQGNGLSGPYQLAVRDIVPNSETIVIEARDRLHSEQIVSSLTLVRFIDYDLDYVSGQLKFNQPVLSRDSNLNPQFIVADYEVDGVAGRVIDAGGRATFTNKAKTLKIGLTAIHDETDTSKTNLGGVDVRYAPNAANEIRAEFAASNTHATGGATGGATGVVEGTSTAWLVEAEHHGPKYDLLAYVRDQQKGFGVGQTNIGEAGTLKFGVDGRVRLTSQFSLAGVAYEEQYLSTGGVRDAAEAKLDYRGKYFNSRLDYKYVHDTLATGSTAVSQIIQLGATKRLFDNKLELDAQTEFSPNGQTNSVDFPARHAFTARYTFSKAITLAGTYEIAEGKAVSARTARIGFDVKPWTGAKFTTALNEQTSTDYGPRIFAAYGLAQSLPVGKRLTIDFALDGNKTLGGINPASVLNPAQPVASGGSLSGTGALTEDFTAISGGATYRADAWSMTGRAEYRAGQTTDRYGVTLAMLRQIGDGKSFGEAFSYTRANQVGGAATETTSIAMSWAYRPAESRLSWLNKTEVRQDIVRNAVAGQAGPIGGIALTVNGDVTSRRIVNSFSLNWSPTEKREENYFGRSELSVFWGTRYVFDSYNGDDLKGWSNTIGADIKFDLGRMVTIGASGTVRENPGGRSYAYAGGPVLDLAIVKNSNISFGYNFIGYRDLDYQDARYTRKGPFVTLRLKFDQNTLAGLGLLARH
jgi:uncharacterized repeat protein (TIGR01451 family)